MLIASLSLVAFPFMTGFYSKDFILESAFGQFKYPGIAVYNIAVIGAMFTTLYSFKVLYLTFITNPNGPEVNYKNAHEGDIFMSLPLIILALFSVFFGYICKDMFIGLGTSLFTDNSLFIHPMHENMLNTEFGVKTFFKLLPFVFTLALSILFIYVMEFTPRLIVYFKSTRLGYNIFSFFSLRFLVEFIYNRYISRFILNLGGQTIKILDKGSVELVGPYGLEKGVVKLSENLSKLDSGVITSYALYILMALILYMLIPYVFYGEMSLLILVLFGLYIVNKKNSSVGLKLDSSLKLRSCFCLFLHIQALKLLYLEVALIILRVKSYYVSHIPIIKKYLYSKIFPCCIYVYKLLLANTILRLILFIFSSFLVYAGLTANTASLISAGIIWLLILYSCIKAKNKIKHIKKLLINISIITAFWSTVNKGIDSDITLLFLSNQVFLGFKDFDDFDFSNILDNLNLHKKCIGDPGGPDGKGPSDPNPYGPAAYPNHPNFDGLNLQDYKNYFQNNPAVQHYKEFVVKKGVTYKTSNIQESIALYNKKIVPTEEYEIPVKKGFNLKRSLYDFGIYRFTMEPYHFISELQAKIYTLNLEYNTLKKAKIFYNQDGVVLSDDFRNAFEIWQKRQIMIYNFSDIPALYSKIFADAYHVRHGHAYSHAVHNEFIIRDFFDPKIVYDEIRENLLCVELDLMQHIQLLDKLKDQRFNYFNVNKQHFDEFIAQHCKSFLHEHRSAYNLILKGYFKHLEDLSNKAIESMFKTHVHSVYKIHEMCKYNHVDNIRDNIKGFGSDKKLVYNGFKQIHYSHDMTLEKFYKDRPNYPLDSNGLYAKKWYYDEDEAPYNNIKDNIKGIGPNNRKQVFNGFKALFYDNGLHERCILKERLSMLD